MNLATIKDALNWVHDQFQKSDLYFGHGTDNPWDEAVFLVLHTAGLPLGSGEEVLPKPLSSAQQAKIQQLAAKRVQDRIPLAYLLREAWFVGMPFYVDERVLVPRSPMGELIHQQFSPWVNPDAVRKVLDLCTGSGCIAIATAQALPNAEVDATDISADALEVASYNVSAYELEDRVRLIQSDIFDSLAGEKYDLIISNPPYVDQQDMDELPEEYRHEPALGLAAGNDGLSIVKRILREAVHFMSEEAVLICEVGNSHFALSELYPEVPFTWLELSDDEHGVFLLTYDQLLECQGMF